MAIISKIGRKSFKVRALYFLIYALLIVGSVTMVYPFILMISGSMKSNVDSKNFDCIPRFLYDDIWAYRKYSEALFNEKIDAYNFAYSKKETSFETIKMPTDFTAAKVEAMKAFLKERPQPNYAFAVGMISANNSKTVPQNLRVFKKWLNEKYGNDIQTVNRKLSTEYINWNLVTIGEPESYITRRNKPRDDSFFRALNEFKRTIPAGELYYFSIVGFYRKQILQNDYSRKINKYNERHGTHFNSYNDVFLARQYPVKETALTQKDWERFVRNLLGLQYIRIDPSAQDLYARFLSVKYHEKIAELNKKYMKNYKSFADIKMPDKPIFAGNAAMDWNNFITGWTDPLSGKMYEVPLRKIRLTCVDFEFQDYLKEKYSTIEACNKKLGTSYSSFDEIIFPQEDLHYAHFKKNISSIKKEFVTRNYKTVLDFILFHGRAVSNTVIYCLLAVLSALIINPLAAYAMSRYKLPSTYKLLLFMLCTMAFPPMVTAIPNFLMLRSLGLLNTFAALILPAMANGYSIFLLKGFFDSQPQELYESAQIDGASELVLFWQIAMSLSKPILAVIALMAFNIAYANFMFAFIVCQDEKMWTLMVFLYQLQQRSGQAVMYASLIIAAVPTFLIFLFCQNIIMRGIVVPSEK
ncbi:MAG: ABC transporter permease subunit [Lentisphaeria bacterium]